MSFPEQCIASMAAWAARRKRASISLLCAAMALASAAHAQIQRGFDNLSFEVPDLGTNACFVITRASDVPGWNTTETNTSASGSGCNGFTSNAGTPGNGGIELWANGFSGVTSAVGTQHAELNAFNNARLSQSVCLISGELVGFTMAHRGRNSATVADVAEFNIDSAANTVVRTNTTSNGTGGVVECGGLLLGSPSNGPVAGTTDGAVTLPTCSSATLANGWRSYTGNFTWSGTTATHVIGFQAVSASGGIASGNFLDAVNVSLQPVIEFSGSQLLAGEGPAGVPASITVVGNVPPGGTLVNFTVTAGTATLGSDFTTSGSFTIPAGNYPTPTQVPIGTVLTILDDSIIEDNETVQLTIQPNPALYVLSDTTTCGGAAQAASTFTIVDNDADLLTAKSASTAAPVAGVPFQYTVTFRNNTAAPTVAPLTAHDAVAPVADAVPAGLTFTSWTCTASNGASCPGGGVNGTVNGSGAITGSAALPAGSGVAGGLVTYVINAVSPVSSCSGTVLNTSQVTLPTGLQEGSAVQSGFVSPSPGGAANNTATASGTLSCQAATTVTKTDGSPTYTPGGTATYTVVINNVAGPSVAQNVSLSDTLPAGVTLSAAPSCVAAGTATCGSLTGASGGTAVGMSGGSINPGAGNTLTVQIPVAFAASMTANPLVNTATVTADGTPQASASDSDTLQPLTSLAVVKSDGSGTYTPGGTATYTITVTNAGPSDAGDVNLADTLPAGVTLTGSPTCVATGTATCGSITGVTGATAFTATNGLIAAGAGNSLIYSVPVAFAANMTTSPLVNTATATDPGDATPGSGSDSDTLQSLVNLSLVKTATPSGTYLPGQALNYTVQLTNNGPSAASGISINDTVPNSVAVSSWTCTASGAGADCDSGAAGTGASGAGNAITLTAVVLGPGESVSVAISGTAALSATGPITNIATAAPPAGSSCTTPPCNVSSSVTNTDGGAPQLTLTKSASPNAFAVGQAASYTLQVSNTGTSSSVGTITLSDPLPAGITSTATPSGSGWNCAASTATVVMCTTSAVLTPGANAPPVTVPVIVGASAASPSVNMASVSGGGDSTCPAAAHCQSTTTTPVDAPHLELTKVLQGNLVIGVQSLYIISVANTGQAAALAGTVSDTVPTGLTLGTLPANCNAAGQVVTCVLAAGLAPGNSVTFAFPVTPQPSVAGQSLTNSATVSGGGDSSCPAAAHCSDTTTNTVGAPQLSVVKSATPASFVVGVAASYTLQISNTGSAATTAVATVTDTLPTGLTIGTLPAGCSAAGQLVTCTIAAGLATGTPVSIVIPVTPQASLSGLSVTNNATATGGGDPSCPAGGGSLPAHCTGSTTTSIGAPLLEITKSASGANFVVGVPASYTLTVTNTGSAAATAAATISDTIPAGLVIGTLPPGCSAAAQVVTCTIPAGLATGTPVSFVIPVTPSAAASGTVLTNAASVSGGGDPTCPGQAHCSDSISTPVNAPRLSIAKTASSANFVVGLAASYTLTVTNTGSAATTAAATVSDTIPSTLNIGTVPAGCSATGQVVTCTIAAGLATGASVSFVIPVTPTAAGSGTTVTNTATVSGGGDPSCPAAATCSSAVSTPVEAPRLTIAKAANAASFVVGVPASYTLQVTNTGTAATTALATISDTLPGTLTPGTMPAGCTATGQQVTCAIAAGLPPGNSVSFVIPVTPTAAANATTVTNSASVSGGGDASCPGASHCSSSTATPVNAPQLDLLKSASAASFVVGVPASYTLTVTNSGSAATTAAAAVSDTVPAALTVGAPPPGCSATGQVVTCTIAAGLAPGASVALVIPVTATAAAVGTVVTNTATVSGGGDPTCPAAAHCSSSVGVPVDAPALSISKSASATNFVVGVPATYTLTVTNTGSAATTAVTAISDTVPAALTLGAMPAGCSATGQVVTCTLAAGLATGTPVSFVIPVTPTAAASGTVLTNTASVSGGGDPTCPGTPRCSSTVNTPVNAPALSIVKNASPASFAVGVPASFTLTVTNSGSAATTAGSTIAVSDAVAASLTLGTLPAGCTASGQNVNCSIAAGLAAGASVSFVIPVTPAAAAAGTIVSNTATVSGGGDPTCPAAATCSSTVTVPVQAPQLGMAKTASTSNFTVGVAASYTLNVTNNGNAATTAVAVVSDTIPATLSIGTLPAGCSATGQGVTCTVPAGLAPGAMVNFVIPVTPLPTAAGTAVVNTATVSGGGGGCAPCSGSVTVPAGGQADLSLQKSDGGATAVPAGTVQYTLTAANAGPSTAVNVRVADTIPAGLSFVSGSGPGWTCGEAGGVATCVLTSLASGASSNVILVLAASGSYSAPDPITNTATVTSDTPDPLPGNNSGTDTTPVGTAVADLNITKTGPATTAPGSTITYTLLIRNTGPATARAATVVDPTPPGLTLVSASAPCTSGFPCAVGDLANGAAITVTVTYAVPTNFSGPVPIVNTASVSASTTDPTPLNNSSAATTGAAIVRVVPLLSPWMLAVLTLLLGLAAVSVQRQGRKGSGR